MSFARPMTGLAAPLLLLGLGAATLLFDPLGATTALRGRLFDAYQNHMPVMAAPDVTLITFNPASLARNGRWPWPGPLQARLAQALAQAGTRVLVFTAPLDRPDDDPAMLGRMPAVVPILLGQKGLAARPGPRPVWQGRKDPFSAVPAFDAGAGPTPAIAAAAAGLGAPQFAADRDGVVRRMPTVLRLGNRPIPSLAAEAARLAAREKTLSLITDESDPFSLHTRTGLAGLQTGGRPVPTDSDGRFWIDYGAAPQTLDVDAILSGEIGQALNGRIAVLDTPDDIVATPRGPMTRGAVIAIAAQNLAGGTVLARPAFATAAELWSLLLTGGAAMLLLTRLRSWWAGLFVAAAIVLSFYGSWFAFISRHWLLDAVTPSLFLLLLFTAGALVRWRDVAAARAGLRLAFFDSLPRATIERIAHRPQLLSIEGDTRTVTYLVCGVRGLAGLAASMHDDPKAFTQIMQQVLTPLMDQALAHGGTIDRLTADGFAAFWNAPLPDADHALHACEAASGMSIMASRVGEQIGLVRGALPALEIGVGVATGAVIAGGFGGAGRLGYSVNGDVVAQAARIQALSPQYGPAVIVAEETQRMAGRSFAFLEVDYVAAGREDPPLRLYALLGTPVARASPKFRALIAFHEHIFASLQRQQWGKARELIAQCRRLSGASQKLYDLHLARIGYFERNPPGPEWDGAFRPILK